MGKLLTAKSQSFRIPYAARRRVADAELEIVMRAMTTRIKCVHQPGYDAAKPNQYRIDIDEVPALPGRGLGPAETDAFLWMHYAAWRVITIRRRITTATIRRRDVREIAEWQKTREKWRQHIFKANEAVVLSMVFRAQNPKYDQGDAIQDASLTLDQSICYFDVSRGFRFSTYAAHAIKRALSRGGIQRDRWSVDGIDHQDGEYVVDSGHEARFDAEHDVAAIMRRARLTRAERSVLSMKYEGGAKLRRRLDREIESRALGKLRAACA